MLNQIYIWPIHFQRINPHETCLIIRRQEKVLKFLDVVYNIAMCVTQGSSWTWNRNFQHETLNIGQHALYLLLYSLTSMFYISNLLAMDRWTLDIHLGGCFIRLHSVKNFMSFLHLTLASWSCSSWAWMFSPLSLIGNSHWM